MKHIVALLLAVVVAGCGGHGGPDNETDERTEAKKEIVEREVVVQITVYDLLGKQLRQFHVTEKFDSCCVWRGENYVYINGALRFRNVTYVYEYLYRDTLDPNIKVMGSKEEFWPGDTGETQGL